MLAEQGGVVPGMSALLPAPPETAGSPLLHGTALPADALTGGKPMPLVDSELPPTDSVAALADALQPDGGEGGPVVAATAAPASVGDWRIALPAEVTSRATPLAQTSTIAGTATAPPVPGLQLPTSPQVAEAAPSPTPTAATGGATLASPGAVEQLKAQLDLRAGTGPALKPLAASVDSASTNAETTTATAAAPGRAPGAAVQANPAQAATPPPLPLFQGQLDTALVERVMWMSSHQLSRAEVAVDPPELGPLQIRVSTQNDQTSVVISAQHASARDALDQALPRLRDMLGAQGMGQVDVGVSDGRGESESWRGERGGSGFAADESSPALGADDSAPASAPVSRSLVDAYA